VSGDRGADLLDLYDRALPQVYGYLVRRVGNPAVAEDLTGETFLAAAQAVKNGGGPRLSTAWLVTVARNKLVDHWRHAAVEEEKLPLVGTDDVVLDEDADLRFERARARAVLLELGPHHRCALTLRYLDGLPVAEVAVEMGRTVHATEALLVRARSAFRAAYAEEEEGGVR